MNIKYATSVYVATLYSVFIVILFAGFSCYISRVNLSSELIEDKVGSLDKVIFLTAREQEIRRGIDSTSVQLIEQQQQLFELGQKKDLLNSEIYQKTANLIDQFIPISTAISKNESILDSEFVDRYRNLLQDSDAPYFDQAERLSAVLSTVRFREPASTEQITDFTDEVKNVLLNLANARADLYQAEAAGSQLNQQKPSMERNVDEVQALINKGELELSQINSVINNEHRALIASFQNSLGGFPYRLIQIPTIILTLIVTIAAGGLGSVVAFTKNFVRGKATATPGLLFVNVGEGVAAAVAIFLFAGAGMLMLTQGGGGTKGAIELTPYMVAFIAFVSGFMAEDAFSRIQIAGQQIFKGPSTENGNGGSDAS